MMPREKLMESGPEKLSDAELLAIFLRTGLPGTGVLELARQLLGEFNGLRGLMEADRREFLAQPGLGIAKYTQLAAAVEMSRRYLRQGLKKGIAITDPLNQ